MTRQKAEQDQHKAEREPQTATDDARVKKIVDVLHEHKRWLRNAAIAGGSAVIISAVAIGFKSCASHDLLVEMQAEQRPLLSVKLTPVTDFVFNRLADGSESPEIYIKFTVTNVGKTLAMLVTEKAEMHDGTRSMAKLDETKLLCAHNSRIIVPRLPTPVTTLYFRGIMPSFRKSTHSVPTR